MDRLTLKSAAATYAKPRWAAALEKITGESNLFCDIPTLWIYSRDRSPFANFRIRNGQVPKTLPSAVVRPADAGEISEVVKFARRHAIAIIPYGAGSGVLGGTLPLANELVLDTKRLNRLLDINEVDGTATVEAGMNGAQFEKALNERGFTAGHFPQSLHMSTVGGWVACRGAGQASTRYGKIEDIVLGLEVVLPDGRLLRIRPVSRRSTGPSLKDLFVGSEGIFGIVTQVTLRIWRLPETRHGATLAFPGVTAGFDAMRRIMQSELRPAVLRLYDEQETSQRTKGIAEFASRPVLAILEFSGPKRLADLERDMALDICAASGAVRTQNTPYDDWQGHRFTSSSAPWYANGRYSDTIEIIGNWSALPRMHAAMTQAVQSISSQIQFSAHWSHFYPEGACQYMTLRLPAIAEDEALSLLGQVWQRVQNSCIEMDGSISHHHGIGLFRNPWMRGELGTGLDVMREIKLQLDPENLFVPGKLGLDDASEIDGSI